MLNHGKREANNRWRGGRYADQAGYVHVLMPEHRRARAHGYVLEHVLVAEAALGRPLPRDAVVHHIDENRSNNRGDNLVICPDRAYHRLIHRRMFLREAQMVPGVHRWCPGIPGHGEHGPTEISEWGRHRVRCRRCHARYERLRAEKKLAGGAS